MRPGSRLRGVRAAQLTIVLISLAAPASALAALSGGGAPRAAEPRAARPARLAARVSPRHITVGDPVRVAGRAVRAAAGATVQLQAEIGTHGRWRRLAGTRVRGGGR